MDALNAINRRSFVKKTAAVGAGLTTMASGLAFPEEKNRAPLPEPEDWSFHFFSKHLKPGPGIKKIKAILAVFQTGNIFIGVRSNLYRRIHEGGSSRYIFLFFHS